MPRKCFVGINLIFSTHKTVKGIILTHSLLNTELQIYVDCKMVAPGVYHLQRVSSTRSLSEVKVKERHMKRVQFEDKMKVYRIRSRKHLT